MSEFTDADRERAQKTLTLIETHVRLSDDRHKEYIKKFDAHEGHIKKNTTFRVWISGVLFAGGTGIGAAVTKIFGDS